MLKLGTQTGSLMNHVMSATAEPAPEVGMGATRLGWTDRHACTIVEVLRTRAGQVKAVVVQRDKATRTDSNGMSEAQSYAFEPDPNASRVTYSLRKTGRFVRAGDSMGGDRLLIGRRDEYYDYSF